MAQWFTHGRYLDGRPYWYGKDTLVPGAIGCGETYDEAWRDLQSAIEDLLTLTTPALRPEDV